ncbi:MAG: penicillin acylase family protein [Promethearchaeota archaeon]
MPLPREIYKQIAILATSIGGVLILAIFLSTPIMGMFALGPIVSPGGIFGAPEGSIYASGSITVSGITDPVTIIRDSWGIPHIYGKSNEDVAFALGYAHATDRLFQMEMTIRTGLGRMSEIMGNSSLEDDLWYQTIGIEKAAQEMLDTYEQERSTDSILDRALNIIDAYCVGVNTVINQKIQTKTLPIEFKLLNFEPTPWTPLKTFVYNRLMSLMLTYSTYDLHATIIKEELFDGNESRMEEVFPVNNTFYQVPVVPTYGNYTTPPTPTKIVSKEPQYSEEEREVLKAAVSDVLDRTPESVRFFQQSWIGSNNWVAGGSKTVTGKPILANDMHLSIGLPHIWYEAHLVASDDDLNVYGYTLTGTPVVIAGFNTHLAWGFTNVGNDAVDWYEYIWNEDKSQYWSGEDNTWKSPTERVITIPVKDKADYTATIRYTEDGVLMTERGKTLAMRWTATYSPTYEIIAMYGVNHAKNWQEFNASMEYFHDPTQNVVYADSAGNIALRPTGRFIKRSYFGEGRFIQNGSDPTHNKDWEFIPFNELPMAMNPAQGYLASANQKSTGPDYPYYISSTQAAGYRGRSINHLLSEAPDGSIDVDFMKDAQCGRGGIFDTCAEAFTPYFINATEDSGLISTGTIAEDALNALKAWQASADRFLMNKTLVGPLIYQFTMNRFREFVWEDEYEAAGSPSVARPQDNTLEYLVKNFPNSAWFDDVSTITVENRDDIMAKAFLQAVEDLEESFGSDVSAWKWGEYHQMYYSHLTGIPAFSRGPFPHDGSGYTLLAAGGRIVRGGPSERLVVDFDNISNSWSVIPTGASGIPTNPHYDDQIALWLNAEYHPMLIQHNTVTGFPEEYLTATLVLNPI